MKKKILCLLLALTLLPLGFLFAGCSKEVYSLTSLKTDFENITTDCTSFTTDNDGKIIVDYSVYKYQGQDFLKNIIETKEPYNQLNEFYNKVFDNSMVFAYSYLNTCAKDNIGVSESLANKVKTKLNKLSTEIKKVDEATTLLADVVRFAKESTDEFDDSCINQLSNLFGMYEPLLSSALDFNNAIARIYFGYALPDSNVDYSAYVIDSSSENNFKKETTIASAISFLSPKIKYQIINLTQCMLEFNVKANNLPSKFTTAPYQTPGEFYDIYKEKVSAINQTLDSTKAKTIAEDVDDTNAQTLLDNLVRLYNTQNVITNNTEMYSTAFATIEYAKVKQDINNATITEKMCVDIIENYNEIINDYQEVLSTIVNFIVTL